MMKYMTRVVFGGLVLLLPISGFACSMAQWDSNSGPVIVGSPQTNPAVPRFSESCGLQITAPNTGHVQDNTPDSSHTLFIARFYVRPNLSGSGQADLFVAYSDEAGASPLVKVSYDGTNLGFHAAAGVLATAAAAANLWHLVEIEYTSEGTTRFWVDADATTAPATDTYSSATGAVSSVRLGLPNGGTGFTGVAQFDAYESHSTTPVGSLIFCDVDGGLEVDPNINDITTLIDEVFVSGNLAQGQPDCDRNGAIDLNDILVAIDLAF